MTKYIIDQETMMSILSMHPFFWRDHYAEEIGEPEDGIYCQNCAYWEMSGNEPLHKMCKEGEHDGFCYWAKEVSE